MAITYSRPSGVNPPRPFQNSEALGRRGGRAGCGRCGTGRSRPGPAGAAAVPARPLELLGQRAAFAAEDDPGRGLEQDRGRRPGPGPRRRTNTPPGLSSSGPAGPALEVGLEPLGGVAGPLVEEDEVEVQAAAADVGVPLHELAGQRLVVGRADAGQHDRPVAGDGVRPEARLAQPVGGDGVRRRAAPGR